MGCLNGTCGVTNLPIYEEDRVVLIPLMGRAPDAHEPFAGKGMVENDVLAAPTGLHIRGTYSGYYFEPDSNSIALDALVELMAAYVKNGSRLLRVKEVRPRFSPVKRVYKGLELLSAIQNGSLAFKMEPETVPFGSMLVLESTFDRLVEEAGKVTFQGFTDTSGNFVKKRHKASNQLKLLLDIGKSFDAKTLKELDALADDSMKSIGFTREHFQFGLAYALMSRRAAFAMSLTTRAASDETVFKVLTEFLLFQNAFDGLRKSWQFQAGLSQAGLDEFGAYYKVVADSIYESLAARK